MMLADMADIVDAHDIGMLKPHRDARLVQETRRKIVSGEELRRNDL